MVLTTTQSIEQQMIVDTATVSFSFQHLENNLQKWQRAIAFLRKENAFFIEMLELSIRTARGNKTTNLTALQQKMECFEKEDVGLFSQQLQEGMTGLITNNEARSLNLEEAHKNLAEQWETIDAIFKGLKSSAFEKIESSIPVRIY